MFNRIVISNYKSFELLDIGKFFRLTSEDKTKNNYFLKTNQDKYFDFQNNCEYDLSMGYINKTTVCSIGDVKIDFIEKE